MRTSLYAILCIVIRLGAVFLAFGMLVRIPGIVVAGHAGTYDFKLGVALGAIAVALLIALVLWVYPGVIARLVTGRNSREVFDSPIAPAELQWIALSVLGAYFLMSALVDIASYGLRWTMFASVYASSDENRMQLIADIVDNVIQLILGAALAFGARGLTDLLRRVRYGEAARSAEVEPAE